MTQRIITSVINSNFSQEDIFILWERLFFLLRNDAQAFHDCVQYFKNVYAPKELRMTGSGRGALYMLLRSFGVTKGDEVIIQAFTCKVVVNAILAVGATPMFVDVDDSLNIDVNDLVKKISNKTKAVIVQHTFGIPVSIKKLRNAVRYANVYWIEDCAHSFGARVDDMLVGAQGDAAFFSFGRDKMLSSVWGGCAMINRHCVRNPHLSMESIKTSNPTTMWIIRQMTTPILFALAFPLYPWKIGDIIIEAAKRFGWIDPPVTKSECRGIWPSLGNYDFSKPLAHLLLNQLQKFSHTLNDRKMIAQIYHSNFSLNKKVAILPFNKSASYMRYSIFVSNREEVVRAAKKEGIYLTTWYSNLIDPIGSTETMPGFCASNYPHAVKKASTIINLPTTVSKCEAERIITCICQHAV